MEFSYLFKKYIKYKFIKQIPYLKTFKLHPLFPCNPCTNLIKIPHQLLVNVVRCPALCFQLPHISNPAHCNRHCPHGTHDRTRVDTQTGFRNNPFHALCPPARRSRHEFPCIIRLTHSRQFHGRRTQQERTD